MSEATYPSLVTIDGLTGVGKSTLALWLSDYLYYPHLETGLIYRVAARRALEQKFSGSGDPADLLRGVEVLPRMPGGGSTVPYLAVEGLALDVRHDLFSSVVDAAVTRVASNPALRARVVELCRAVMGSGPMILTGRDTGRTIAPDARGKLFLTARDDVLAARSAGESRTAGGGVRSAASARSRQERQALAAYIAPAKDARIIDTSELTIDEVQAITLAHLRDLG